MQLSELNEVYCWECERLMTLGKYDTFASLLARPFDNVR